MLRRAPLFIFLIFQILSRVGEMGSWPNVKIQVAVAKER